MQNFVNLLSLAASASALALPVQKRADQSFTSNFDDLTTNVGSSPTLPRRPIQRPRLGVVVLRPIEGVASVVPHSKPQHAGAAGPLDLLQLGEQLPVTTFSYVPDGTLNADLIYAELPETFRNFKNVTFAVASSEPISEWAYIALDDVKHINHIA